MREKKSLKHLKKLKMDNTTSFHKLSSFWNVQQTLKSNYDNAVFVFLEFFSSVVCWGKFIYEILVKFFSCSHWRTHFKCFLPFLLMETRRKKRWCCVLSFAMVTQLENVLILVLKRKRIYRFFILDFSL